MHSVIISDSLVCFVCLLRFFLFVFFFSKYEKCAA